MTHTLSELKEFLKSNASEDDILDVLKISVEDLVERFDDLVDDNFDSILDYFGLAKDEEEEEDDE